MCCIAKKNYVIQILDIHLHLFQFMCLSHGLSHQRSWCHETEHMPCICVENCVSYPILGRSLYVLVNTESKVFCSLPIHFDGGLVLVDGCQVIRLALKDFGCCYQTLKQNDVEIGIQCNIALPTECITTAVNTNPRSVRCNIGTSYKQNTLHNNNVM